MVKFAPSSSSRFTMTALSAPSYGKLQPEPFFPAIKTKRGVLLTGSSARSSGKGVLANKVFTPNCIPNDHAETS